MTIQSSPGVPSVMHDRSASHVINVDTGEITPVARSVSMAAGMDDASLRGKTARKRFLKVCV